MDEIEINGKKLVCLFCGNNTFDTIKTLMNRRFLAMLDLEMFNFAGKKGLGKAFICKKCGYKHEFFGDLPQTRKERLNELNPLKNS